MAITREALYQALFALASGVIDPTTNKPLFVTTSRRLKHWSRVQPEEQPALFQRQLKERIHRNQSGIPIRWLMEAEFYIYVTAGNDETIVPTQLLNPLIDAVMNALKPKYEEKQTLGKLAYNVSLDEEVEIFEGVELAGQAAAIMKVQIFTAEL